MTKFVTMVGDPSAILLDVGGVFLLPLRSRIRSALARCGQHVEDGLVIDRAHYLSTRAFPMEPDGDLDTYWEQYLERYVRALDVDESVMSQASELIHNEYVSGDLWSQVIEGSKEGLRGLVDTGVPVGVVSNSDGDIESHLRSLEVLQVGPGQGVEVRCVVDSGAVGVEKPDPAIFDFAFELLDVPADGTWYVGDTPAFDVVGARRAGMGPLLMDPFGVNGDHGVECVTSLSEVADLVVTS